MASGPASAPVADDDAGLTEAETREIVTPYAFRVHGDLLGLPLARPWRRALAILIDGTLVGLLSLVSPAVLMLAASLFLWNGARKPQVRRRGLLRVLALVGALAGTLGILASSESVRGGVEKTAHVVRVAAYRGDVESGACRDDACARDRLDDLAWLVTHGLMEDDDPALNFDEYLQGLALEPGEREDLWRSYQNHLQVLQPVVRSEDAATPEITPPRRESPNEPSYSVLGWARGVLQDLGLSLGWAALYFSAFTALWKGQTPGKRLLRLRVQMLRGGRISWWDAFSRFGGYGAGFATGLLGFLQLTWDANRQAIQDKIAGTVVIYDKAPREPKSR